MRRTKFFVFTLVFMVVFSIAFRGGYSVKPVKPYLVNTITNPQQLLEIDDGEQFTVSGNALCQDGDCGAVDTVVQYCIGQGCTDFVDVASSALMIVQGSQPQSQALPDGGSYDVIWTLTGNPGTYELRIRSTAFKVTDGNSDSRTVVINGDSPPPPPPGNETIDSEYQDSSIGFGTASGDYTDTHAADGTYEILSEQKNDQGTKNPTDDTSELGWIYIFNNLGTRTDTVFCLYGHAYFTGSDSDTAFLIQEETSGPWSTMFSVSSTSDSLYCADLPDDSSSTLRIRVVDNDQTPKNKEISSIYVDQAYIYLDDNNPPVSVDVTLDAIFYDSGDTVYVEADVTLSDSNPMETGTVTATFKNDYNYDETYDSTYGISLSYDPQSQTWKGNWAPTTSGYYLVEVEATNGDGAEYGYEDFHLYPGSGVSAYMFDWNGDEVKEFVLENKHMVTIYKSGSTYEPLAMVMQKDTGVSYILSGLSDPNANGRLEPVTTTAGRLSFGSITSADSLSSATLTSQSVSNLENDIIVGGFSIYQRYFQTWHDQGSSAANDYNITTSSYPTDIIVIDIDGDGDMETVVGEGETGRVNLQVFESQSGTLQAIHNLQASIRIEDIDVGDIDNDDSTDLEIFSCEDSGGQSTIWKKSGSNYVASYVIPQFSACDAADTGDLDNDGDTEIVISAMLGGWCDVLLYENQSDGWVNVANYSTYDDTCGIYHLEIADVDIDGTNEILYHENTANAPLQVLKYTGGSLVNFANLERYDGFGFVTGDVTNDGNIDIAIPAPPSGLIYVYEKVSGNFVNTFNISFTPQSGFAGFEALRVGDIDSDGDNELVMGHMDDSTVLVFRESTYLYSFEIGQAGTMAIAIGDADNDAASSFRLDVTMNSGDADYLVYKISEFGDDSSVYFPIAGVIDTVSDDQYRVGTNGGYITSLTQGTWTDFTLGGSNAYVCTYDSQTSDVIGFAKGAESTGVSIDKLSVWNEASNSEAMRIKYDTSSSGASDYAEFLFVFTQGDYTTIANHMMNISYGIYPVSLYNY